MRDSFLSVNGTINIPNIQLLFKGFKYEIYILLYQFNNIDLFKKTLEIPRDCLVVFAVKKYNQVNL